MLVNISFIDSGNIHFTEETKNPKKILSIMEYLSCFRVKECRVMGSKKRPLWLSWTNPDPLAQISFKDLKIIFKNGDGKKNIKYRSVI